MSPWRPLLVPCHVIKSMQRIWSCTHVWNHRSPNHFQWASFQIRKLRVTHAPGMSGTFPRHHGPAIPTCETHVPWCMPGSLTSGFLWSRYRGKRSRHSRRMRSPQFYVSDKRPMRWNSMIEVPVTTVRVTSHIKPWNIETFSVNSPPV